MKRKEKWAREQTKDADEPYAWQYFVQGFDFAKRQIRCLNEDVMMNRRERWTLDDIKDLGESEVEKE